jgi:hypothetical protein
MQTWTASLRRTGRDFPNLLFHGPGGARIVIPEFTHHLTEVGPEVADEDDQMTSYPITWGAHTRKLTLTRTPPEGRPFAIYGAATWFLSEDDYAYMKRVLTGIIRPAYREEAP